MSTLNQEIYLRESITVIKVTRVCGLGVCLGVLYVVFMCVCLYVFVCGVSVCACLCVCVCVCVYGVCTVCLRCVYGLCVCVWCDVCVCLRYFNVFFLIVYIVNDRHRTESVTLWWRSTFVLLKLPVD